VKKGTYDIWVSRGIEWTRAVAKNVVVDDKPLLVKARLRRAVSLPGWWSADFHVHMRPSGDSPVRTDARVRQMAADGVDIVVATDHNVVTDLAPDIAKTGLTDHIAAIPGVEVTTYSVGHFGAFPLPYKRKAYRRGAIRTTPPNPLKLFSRVREKNPDAVIIINHPWGHRRGYFHQGGLDAEKGTLDDDRFGFGFHGIELLNGFHAPAPRVLDLHLEQWFALLRAGRIFAGTGNSDSHKLEWNQGGYPRNYVKLHAKRHRDVRGADLADAVRARQLFFTTGPLVQLTTPDVPDAVMGDKVEARADGKLTVRLQVWGAPWIDVDRARLFHNGRVAKTWTVPHSTRPERLDVTATVDVEAGDFVLATVAGMDPLWPTVGEPDGRCERGVGCYRFDVPPVAVTNPLFVR